MSTEVEDRLVDQARRVALPSLIGMEVGHRVWEGPWKPYPFLLDAERELVAAAIDQEEQQWFILNAPNQIGKALALSEKLPTPSGWTTMGEVRVGDQVLGADGRPCNVVGMSQVYRAPIHRVVFDDGSTIDACKDHRWQTFDFNSFRSYSGTKRGGDLRLEHDPEWWDWRSGGGKGSEVRTTEDLLNSLHNKHGQSNHSIPNASPLQLPDAELPIAPWVLGYWLGNGTRDTGTMASGSLAGDLDHKHVLSMIEGAGESVSSECEMDGKGHGLITVADLRSRLRGLGIEKTKMVPPIYMRASESQRRALLAGLMDSDGGPENAKKLSGSVSFSSKDEHLVLGVQELAHSLGCKTRRLDRQAKLNGKDCGPSYRVFFTPPFNPFTLPRKAVLWQPSEDTGRAMQRRTRQIVDIEVLEEVVEMRCISVDSPGNLYLAGEQMVPTHNTSYAVLFIFWYIGMFPDKQVIFISYSGEYSSEQGRMVRELFRMYGEELFGLTVDPDNDSQGDWSLKDHPSGGMLSVGWTGQIQGRQGHLVWIDDLLRTIVEAASGTTKDAQWSEWKGTMWGRRQPGSVYVVSQTRLADDDLSGRLITEMNNGGGIDWKLLTYPGICWVPDDYDGDPETYRDRLGRAPGEPLITRFSRPSDTPENNWWKLAEKQLDAPAVFDCMVQQNPNNSESGMFPEDRWVFEPRDDWPALYLETRVWDIAGTKGSGDYTCGALVGKGFDGRYYIEGRYREQVGPDVGIQAVKDHAALDGHAVVVQVEQGKSGSEKQLTEFYAQGLPGYTVEPAKADGTKEQRATTYSVLQQQRKIVLPADEEDAEWVGNWIKEHRAMMGDGRKPRHDDQIDAAAYAVRWLSQHDSTEWHDPNDLVDDLERQIELQQMLETMGL